MHTPAHAHTLLLSSPTPCVNSTTLTSCPHDLRAVDLQVYPLLYPLLHPLTTFCKFFFADSLLLPSHQSTSPMHTSAPVPKSARLRLPAFALSCEATPARALAPRVPPTGPCPITHTQPHSHWHHPCAPRVALTHSRLYLLPCRSCPPTLAAAGTHSHRPPVLAFAAIRTHARDQPQSHHSQPRSP